MSTIVQIGDRFIGGENPVYFVAEVGINHNGDIELARKLIDAAADAGCDAVKFQKRTPELCVPPDQRHLVRETPWGLISYLEYRHRIEFGFEHYRQIDEHCRQRRIHWFASPWDEPSVDFLEQFHPVAYKIPSAALTDRGLRHRVRETGRPIILSTGMSTLRQVREAVADLPNDRLILMHTTSTYPCKAEELNLRVIQALAKEFNVPIGYSGHETGLQATLAAVALDAKVIERHITLDRAMWGTDQGASVEPHGISRLVRDIRIIEQALGDGVKRVYDSELPALKKLRRYP